MDDNSFRQASDEAAQRFWKRGPSARSLKGRVSTVLGLAGLGTEVAAWYTSKQTMQGAADAAAYTAVTALSKGASVAQLTTEARSIAAKYGFTSIQGNSTLTVNSPPLSGSYAGKSTAVEVTASALIDPACRAPETADGPSTIIDILPPKMSWRPAAAPG